MEFFTILLIVAIILALVKGRISTSSDRTVPKITKQQECENRVSSALRSIDFKSYVIFDNLILPSGGNTTHTEIDHVVVSPYGIFCVETKSHQGSIYGNRKSTYWKQYLGGQEFKVYNPYYQNYKHIKALEALLGSNLKSPLHSYVVFPNASKVKIDGIEKNADIEEVIRQIANHKKNIYTLTDCEHILKSLAYESSKSPELSATHTKEVQAYLNNKPA